MPVTVFESKNTASLIKHIFNMYPEDPVDMDVELQKTFIMGLAGKTEWLTNACEHILVQAYSYNDWFYPGLAVPVVCHIDNVEILADMGLLEKKTNDTGYTVFRISEEAKAHIVQW